MDCAQTVDHRRGVDADNTAAGETLLQDIERALVIRMTENRNDDGAVADIKISVTGRQAHRTVADDAGNALTSGCSSLTALA